MIAYLIDPLRKLVINIYYDGTAADLARSYEDYSTDRVQVKTGKINDHDFLTYADEPVRPDDAATCWHIYCPECQGYHCCKGIGIITGSIRGDKDSLGDPIYSLRAYREAIGWGYKEEVIQQTEGLWMGSVEDFLEWLGKDPEGKLN